MQSLRQLGGGVIIALISVILVIGGISLALSESLPPQTTPTPILPTVSLEFPTATFTPSPAGFESPTPFTTITITPTPFVLTTDTLFPTNTLFVQPSCNPPSGWVRIITRSGDTVYSLAQSYKTTAEALGAANCLSSFDIPAGLSLYVPPVPTVTVIPCGPPAGYVRRHRVQPGDNLFRIALSYGITYPVLQRANCMGSSTTIYAGQLLWVPNVPTRTPVPGVTIFPTFPTATPTNTVRPTFTPSNTPVSPVPQYP